MRKSEKGQLKMEAEKKSTGPTDPLSMEYEIQYSEKFPNDK